MYIHNSIYETLFYFYLCELDHLYPLQQTKYELIHYST